MTYNLSIIQLNRLQCEWNIGLWSLGCGKPISSRPVGAVCAFCAAQLQCYYSRVSVLREGVEVYNEGLWAFSAAAVRPPERNHTTELRPAPRTRRGAPGLFCNDFCCGINGQKPERFVFHWLLILYSVQLLTLCSFHFTEVNGSRSPLLSSGLLDSAALFISSTTTTTSSPQKTARVLRR